ncbi:MAG: DUF4912 domain-containing protein [Pseudanabaenaceae cyanobacterium SKYGB_i_bin29]|nr:DUF4912 domain-containing protein [Pseudanabaenaceae cyanobacterium SKYG29]MDW8420846.1 DUF4912 domain-containing protein [Pseudanabaenaceae cyanobacterium SKYGB_i_bin29]
MAQERPPLEEMTLRQLRKIASEYAISRYSRMRKSQLLKAIQAAKLGDLVRKHEPQPMEERETVEAKKFELGQASAAVVAEATELAMVDWNLGDLPAGYGEPRIVLLPRDPQWAYAYWDIPDSAKEACRRQGGQQLALRIYDVTDINLDYQMPHTVQEYACDEMAREWYLPIPMSDRSYVVEIGYRTNDGRWLMLARSASIHVPPVYPTDWTEDYFLSIPWEQTLIGRTFFTLMPKQRTGVRPAEATAIMEQRQPGSIFGSMQMAEQAVSSFAVPGSVHMSGVGMEKAVPGSVQLTASGVGLGVPGSMQLSMSGVGFETRIPGSVHLSMSGVGFETRLPGSVQLSMSGVGLETFVPGSVQLTASGLGFLSLSGVGLYSESGVGYLTASGLGLLTLSGIGLFSAAVPQRPRQFWLVADAELIVYGATEPDATVTIGGQRIELNPDGTFRHHMSFQDGVIDYPILAVAADGVQTRSIHMRFERQTLERRTNTKEEAIPEWIRE